MSTKMMNSHWKLVLTMAALLCTSTLFETANAFQSHQHRTLVSAPALSSIQRDPLLQRAESRSVMWAPSSNRASRTHLNAVPAASAILASAGGLLASIGNLLVPSSASVVSKILRVTALFMAGALAASNKLRMKALYPGLKYPESKDHDLLPGPVGCPFLGIPQIYATGNPSYGAGDTYRKIAANLGKKLGAVPKIWKYYIFGQPAAVLSGGKTFQKVLSMEFGGKMTSSGVDIMEGGLLNVESLLFERSKKRHSYLRRLVGAALTPAAVAKTAPLLQSAAEQQVDRMLQQMKNEEEGSTVKFHQVCTDYTLDVAWRQILGLQLTEEEIPAFEENVAKWIEGVTSLQVILKINIKGHPGYKAKQHLISKIEERIDQLLEQGPDNTSTLSGMVFATDEEDPTKKLSRQEIIDNALILIFAGSETSASTLTNAMLFLGLHPTVWNKLAEEQAKIQAIDGDTLTPETVDASKAPYMDAVLKETMRMRAVIGGIPRNVLEDIDVDGDGKTVIPKGYMVDPSMLMTHEEDPNVKLPDGMHMDAIQGFRPERWIGGPDPKPDSDWYVPYGYGPRYCLGKNLAQLEMKIFLATMVRKLDFPVLSMLPENYDYSPNKKEVGSKDYFSVEWSTKGAVIPTAGDGVLASVTAKEVMATPSQESIDVDASFPVYNVTGVSNSTKTQIEI